jgi:predicted permease
MWRLFRRRRLRASGASASLAEARSRGERAEAGHRFERDMDEELAFHLQSRIDDHVRRGLNPADAERRARLEFGGVDKYKEQIRDARPLALVDDLARDLTYAWRSLRRTPVFASTAIVAIALGVAVNAGLVTLVYALVLRPLPVKDPGTIRNVFMSTRGGGSRGTYGTPYFVSFPEFVFMRSQSRTADLAAVAEASLSCTCAAGGQLRAQLVSDNLLPLIGARPALGRFFTADETKTPGSAPLVVLSWATWQQQFGAAQDVVGRMVNLNRTPFTIVGVADADATGPLVVTPDVWLPYTMQAITRPGGMLIDEPTFGWIQILARRRPGVSDSAMRAELSVLGQQSLLPHNPDRTATVVVSPGAFLNYPMIMQNGAPVMAIAFLAVSLVLLIACANVANMLLARGLGRRREIAIRVSLGAGRARLLRQFLTESAVIGALGGVIGLMLSQAAARFVLASVPKSAMTGHQIDLSPDWWIVAYTLTVSLATSLFFGSVPALRLIRRDLTPALKTERGIRSLPGWRIPLQSALVAGQTAITLVLLVNAGLLVRGLDRALRMDLGQRADNVLIASFNLQQEQYTAEPAGRLLMNLRDAVAQSAGVVGVSMTVNDPLLGGCGMRARTIGADGRPSERFDVACEQVGGEYFKTMRVAVLRGRDFTLDDVRRGARAAVVDERFARARFGDADPLGRFVRLGRDEDGDDEIVGVVATTSGIAVDRRIRPKVYTPIRGFMEGRLLIAHDGRTEAVVSVLRARVAEADPNLLVSIKSIEENVRLALSPVRIAAAAAAALGLMGLVLACSGLYGVVAFSVSRRLREIGIRVALGANRTDLLRMIVGQGLRPVAAGGAIGLLLAAAGGHLIRALLFGVSPIDPITFTATVLALLAAAALAAIVPALTALRLDPMVALRDE